MKRLFSLGDGVIIYLQKKFIIEQEQGGRAEYMERIEMKKHRIVVAEKAKQRQYISDSDAEMDIRAVEAVRAAVSKAEICKKPIAKYDAATKKAYIEYPDGRREYAK